MLVGGTGGETISKLQRQLDIMVSVGIKYLYPSGLCLFHLSMFTHSAVLSHNLPCCL